MPQQIKPQVPVKESVQPSRGFLSRIFGSDPFTPEMEEGIRIARQEMPNMAPVQPYGFFSRLLQPKVMGYVSPGNNIYLNPATNVGQTPQEIADTLTHEQEHIKQQKESGYGPTARVLMSMFGRSEPYYQRPNELAAFQAEKLRRSRMGRTQTAIPSISGNWYVPRDINLPNPKPKQSVIMPKTMY